MDEREEIEEENERVLRKALQRAFDEVENNGGNVGEAGVVEGNAKEAGVCGGGNERELRVKRGKEADVTAEILAHGGQHLSGEEVEMAEGGDVEEGSGGRWRRDGEKDVEDVRQAGGGGRRRAQGVAGEGGNDEFDANEKGSGDESHDQGRERAVEMDSV